MTVRKLLLPLIATSLLTLPTLAQAAPGADGEAEGEAEGSVSLGGDAGADADANADAGGSDESSAAKSKPKSKSKYSLRKDQKWIKRWAPEKNMVELGVYGGALLLAETHELFGADLDLPDQGYKPLRALNPDLGARVGYYPIRFFGVEAEGGVMPSKLRDASGNAMLYTFRAHAVAQLGLWSVTPFVLVGAGGWGVSSPRGSLGNDIDPALHFGGGVKIYINRWVMLRLDVRDIISHQQSVDATFKSHNLEALLGLSVTLGRKKDKDARTDRDGDGFYDDEDTCIDEAGVAPDGCPIRDTDGDGILDPDDSCIDKAETFNEFNDEDGCPESDRDGDTFWDDDGTGASQDTCSDQAGVAPDGCPIPDTDSDGILDPDDACIPDPETKNGFEDVDGCPDVVPSALAKFNGAIKGITFDNDQATIRASSKKTLDDAAKVLTEYPDIRIEIAGHTDDTGDREHNVDLSRRRAEAVEKYLIDKGIAADRMETIGHGPDQPAQPLDAAADSKKMTKQKRSANRRIEFKMLSGK